MTGAPLAIPVQGLRRRTGTAGPPATLLAGQTFSDEVGNVTYVGVGANGTDAQGRTIAAQVIATAGAGAFADLASAQTITGPKTFASPIIATVDMGADTPPTNTLFVAPLPTSIDLGTMSSPITAISDLGLMSQAAGSAVDLGLMSA